MWEPTAINSQIVREGMYMGQGNVNDMGEAIKLGV